MFITGLKHSGILLLVALPISMLAGRFLELELALSLGYLAVFTGATYFGYTYYSKYGPLLISSDGKAAKRLFQYAMGYGVIFGLPLAISVILMTENMNMLVLVVLACLAVPMTGMKFIGAIALGRFLNRSLD